MGASQAHPQLLLVLVAIDEDLDVSASNVLMIQCFLCDVGIPSASHLNHGLP